MAEQPALPTHPFGYGISADDAIQRIRRINAVSQGHFHNRNFMAVVVEELEMDFAMLREMDFAMLREMDWESFMDAATVRMARLVDIVKEDKP